MSAGSSGSDKARKIEPGQVGGVRRPVGDLRQPISEEAPEPRPVAVQVSHGRGQPLVALLPGRPGGLDPDRADDPVQVLRLGIPRRPQPRRADVRDPATDAGEVEGLGGRGQGDRPGGHRRTQRRDGHVTVRCVDEIRMDLVAEDQQVVGFGQLGQPAQLVEA